jgi:hypothetical protein
MVMLSSRIHPPLLSPIPQSDQLASYPCHPPLLSPIPQSDQLALYPYPSSSSVSTIIWSVSLYPCASPSLVLYHNLNCQPHAPSLAPHPFYTTIWSARLIPLPLLSTLPQSKHSLPRVFFSPLPQYPWQENTFVIIMITFSKNVSFFFSLYQSDHLIIIIA